MIAWAKRQWFLLALATVLVAGAFAHESLGPLAALAPRDPLVAAILLAMSAPIDLRRSLTGGRAIAAAAVGVVIAVLAGPLAWLAGKAFLLSTPLATGLVVAGLSPSTLASGAVWTRRGGGNEAVALAITVATNLLCFATLPFGVWLLLGASQQVDAAPLAVRLLLIVVIPIAVGQALRAISPVRAFFDRHKSALRLGAQVGLLCLVFLGSVQNGERLAGSAELPGPGQIVLLIAAAGAVHVGLFAVAWRVSRSIGAPPAEALGAAIGGSQKTLAVGLAVAFEFSPLAIVPMIVYHALQLVVDTWLVQRFGPRKEPSGEPSV